MSYKNKTLLIITPIYPNKDSSIYSGIFVKNQVNVLKFFFKKIIVIAPTFYLVKTHIGKKSIENYAYENVEVYFPRCIYVPIFWLSKILIDNRFQAVERTIKKHHLNFNLIHAHFTWPSGYIGMKLKEKYREPVIVTVHENGEWFNQEIEMNNPLINATWSQADAIIRVNKKDIPILQQYNNQVYFIPNGFSQIFQPVDNSMARIKLSLPQRKKIIFSLGNLIKRKGFNYLIDAMHFVCDERDNILCYIGGAGSEKRNLQKQVNRLHLEDKIKLLGAVPTECLPLWMNAADLFVLPSLNEGNPTVMFEALGCGVPFIGTKVGGVPEIITSDEYGLLVEPANAKDLAEKILIALDREWNREAIHAYAQQYTWDIITKQIEKIYREVMIV